MHAHPPRAFVKCCVPWGGECAIHEYIISSQFYYEKSVSFKKCMSRSLDKDLLPQNVLFNQNIIAFYRTLRRRK